MSLKVLIFFFLILFIPFCTSADQNIKISLNVEADSFEEVVFKDTDREIVYLNITDISVSLQSIQAIHSHKFPESLPENGEHRLTLKEFSSDGVLIDERFFRVSFFHKHQRANETITTISIKSNPQLEIVKIEYLEEVKLEINIKEMLCNTDGKCDSTENFLSCPSDCPPNHKDGFCIYISDGVCDPDCIFDEDCTLDINHADESSNQQYPSNKIYFLIIGLILGFIFILIFLFLSQKKTKSS
jgi:hypothetical protein